MKLNKDNKALLSNFFSLSTLQGVNMILPLITLPYLVRVLGVENFGLINFALSIIMYFNILVSFGFDLSATREISINRDNPERISEIFSSVMLIKSILFLISLGILIVLILTIDRITEYKLLYVITFGSVLGNVIFPKWFFQGMERMKYITYINVTAKIVFTVLIFILVKKNTDFIYVPLLNVLGSVFGGVYSLWLVFKLFEVTWKLPSKNIILKQAKDSYHFFLSRIANSGSRYYATTIIGMFFGNTVVGYYSMVEKLFFAFMSLGGIVSQTIYPYMSRTKNLIFFKKVLVYVTMVTILILIPVMLFNRQILDLVFSVDTVMLSNIFLIVFSGAIFSIISSLVGYPLLAAFGHIKYANNSLIYASVIYVIFISLAAIYFKNIYLTATSLIVYAFTGLAFRIYYIKKARIFV